MEDIENIAKELDAKNDANRPSRDSSAQYVEQSIVLLVCLFMIRLFEHC